METSDVVFVSLFLNKFFCFVHMIVQPFLHLLCFSINLVPQLLSYSKV